MVRTVDAGRVVDRVGVDEPARQCELDAAALREAEVAAFGDDLAAQFRAVDADRVVGPVADFGVGLGGRLHVSADAAVVEQVGRREQDRAHQLVRRHPLDRRIDAERGARLWRNRDRLRTARPHAAAVGDQRFVVVGPRRARQIEHAFAFGKAAGGVGVRVDEDVAVVERREQPDVPRQQHAVAEHVAGHVADADHGEVLCLRVMPERAEVALHRLPRAARGDAHLLVVVAGRAAGGERVAEPEAVFLRDRRSRCRRTSRCPCRRRRRDTGRRRRGARTFGGGTTSPSTQVVGDIEQAAQERLVARDAFLHQCLAVSARRRALQHEAALAADRHDDRVLHLLRLHEPEHLGAEVLHPVRPAQAAARHLAAAQVHAFDARRVDEDLEHRLAARAAPGSSTDRTSTTAPASAGPKHRAGRSWCATSPGSAPGTGAGCGPRRGSRRGRARSRCARRSRPRRSLRPSPCAGSKRARNSATRSAAMPGCAASACSMYDWLNVNAACFMYRA